jgi:hypothetical protein
MIKITLTCVGLLITTLGYAANQDIDQAYEAAADRAEATLDQLGFADIERASTDRFTLLIGSRGDAHITLTVRSLADGERARVLVKADARENAHLETQILAEMNKATTD